MAQFASAAFTGTNGTLLSTADSNFTKHTSYSANMYIYNNRCRADTSTGLFYHSGSPANADYTVSGDFYAVGVTAFAHMAVVGRLDTAANTCYFARLYQSTGWQLYKIVAGTPTQLGSTYSETVSVGSTHSIQLSMSGTTIKLFSDGTERISVTDSAISAAGKSGIRGYIGTTTDGFNIDNFSGDDAGATTYYQTNTGSFPAPSASLATTVTFRQSTSGNMPYATGTVIKQINKNLVGDVPYSTGSVIKQTNKNLSGDSPAPIGSLGTVFIAKQALTGVLGAITGALSTILNPVAPTLKKFVKLLGASFKKFIRG